MTTRQNEINDYKRIETAIRYIEQNAKSQPSLDAIAAHVHLSKHHFSRLFKQWVGVTPIQFLHFLTVEYTKKCLAEKASLLETAHSAGLSGSSRLHDLFINFEAMTPGDFKQQGANLIIEYGFAPSPFGECLLATTKRGVCYLGFVDEDKEELLQQLTAEWENATFIQNESKIQPIIQQIFYPSPESSRPFTLHVKGTNFQINVWRALLTIPSGRLVSYQDIAQLIGKPKASRAVGTAIANNSIGYLIPCHRVITGTGALKNYRWGTARKKALIGWEAGKRSLEIIEN